MFWEASSIGNKSDPLKAVSSDDLTADDQDLKQAIELLQELFWVIQYGECILSISRR